MSRDELAAAGDLLASAAENTTDPESQETLTDIADQLERLADATHGPDHGRLARIEAKLDDVQTSANDEVAVTVDEAIDAIHAHRETIEGV